MKVVTAEGDVTETVRPGDVRFVKRRIQHRFHDVEQDLQLLVVFASHAREPTRK